MKKAYMIFSGYPQDGCLLVFAETSNKAKSISVGVLFDWEYVQMNSRRIPDFDKYADQVNHPIVERNEDLPDHAPAFYSDYEI